MTEQEYKDWYIKDHRWDYICWRFWRLHFTKKLHTKEAYIQEHHYDYLVWKLDKIVINFGNHVANALQTTFNGFEDVFRRL